MSKVVTAAKVYVCPPDAMRDGEIRKLTFDDRPPVAVYNLNGRFFATDDTCTHGQASLSEGMIFGDEIECPFHGGTFRIETGEAVRAPCLVPLRTYPVAVEASGVYVVLEETKSES